MGYEYILVAQSCFDCGGKIAVMAFNEKPTSEEEKKLVDSLGGMFCINKELFRRSEDGKYERVEEI